MSSTNVFRIPFFDLCVTALVTMMNLSAKEAASKTNQFLALDTFKRQLESSVHQFYELAFLP